MTTQPRSTLTMILILPLILAAAACGRIAFDENEARAKIRDIEHSWAQVAVSGDPAVVEKIFADDFLGVSPDGAHYT